MLFAAESVLPPETSLQPSECHMTAESALVIVKFIQRDRTQEDPVTTLVLREVVYYEQKPPIYSWRGERAVPQIRGTVSINIGRG